MEYMVSLKKHVRRFPFRYKAVLLGTGLLAAILFLTVPTLGKSTPNKQKPVDSTKPSPSQIAHNNTSVTPRPSPNKSERIGTTTDSKSSTSLQTYTSDRHRYSFDYPKDWQIRIGANASGVEQIDIGPKPSPAAKNIFGMTFSVSTDPDSTYQPSAAAQGSIITLPNKLLAWVQPKDTSVRDGNPTLYCPTIQLLSKSVVDGYHFSHSLSGGSYLAVEGGYCTNQGAAPTYSYEQQLASNEWQIAQSSIGSLQFN
ncbi:MAG TPA: hypothetical protein VMY99_01295 [Nevskiaceae bacterium]|nr:hypothetical protein [Nevskiaceae bacterium]